MEMQTEILQMPKVAVPAEVLVVGAVPPCWECALRSARRAGEAMALFFPLYFVSRKKKKKPKVESFAKLGWNRGWEQN